MTTKAVKAKALYIEDEEDWRKAVTTYLTGKGANKFFDFETLPSMKDGFEDSLNKVFGPLILIVDLRMNEGDFAGFDWLMKRVETFVRHSPDTVIMVLSGNLNPEIERQLKGIGIPNKHIFDKGRWGDNRDKFFTFLKETAIMLNNKPSAKKLDPYLSNQIWRFYENVGTNISKNESTTKPTFHMLVKLKNKNWNNDKVPDLRILGKIGEILSCEGTINTIEYLESDPNVETIEASRPAFPLEFEKSQNLMKIPEARENKKEFGDKVIIGVIDNGVDVLHETFLNSSGKNTKLLAVWDQTDTKGLPPKIGGIKGFGTEHKREAINRYIKNKSAPPKLGNNLENEHGTQVASIAAGTPTSNFKGGVAPKAKIVVVMLPNNTLTNNYSSYVIPAIQYLKEKAEKENLPLVINLSQGINAGGHDGSSILEGAIDSITNNGHEEGLVIVKSAGNERDKQAHAFLTMSANMAEELKWNTTLSNLDAGSLRYILPYSKRDFIELWFEPENTFLFCLQGPNGKEESDWVSLLNPITSGEVSGGHKFILNFTQSHRENGSSRLLIETESKFISGNDELNWTLKIHSKTVGTGEIHAWIERTVIGRPVFRNHIDENFTLTIPGTSHQIISVGATDITKPIRLSDYSSCGPTRDKREKPEISAPGEKILAASCGGSYCAVSGTSMAAPHVSGSIALLLSYWQKKKGKISNWRPLTTSQIRKALIASAEHNKWHEGLGYGVVDNEKLFNIVDSWFS